MDILNKLCYYFHFTKAIAEQLFDLLIADTSVLVCRKKKCFLHRDEIFVVFLRDDQCHNNMMTL